MKVVLFVAAVLLTTMGILLAIFFSTGYTDNIDYTANYIEGNNTQQTPAQVDRCASQRQTAAALEAPLRDQANGIAHILVTAPLPFSGGQALYDQYHALELKINRIDVAYECR